MAKNSIVGVGAFTDETRNICNNNFRDVSRCTTQLSATSNTTLANVVGMVTDTLQPGTYTFRVNLGTTANAAGGIKAGFKQSVASMLTSIRYDSLAFAAAAVAAASGTTATDAASLVASTSAVVNVTITGSVVVALAGTLQLQAAQNASNAAATTVEVGSFMEFIRIGN